MGAYRRAFYCIVRNRQIEGEKSHPRVLDYRWDSGRAQKAPLKIVEVTGSEVR